jgi:hypothetical protein
MAEKKKLVLAVFRDHAKTQAAFDWLRSRGYSPSDINVMMSDETRTRYYASDAREGKREKVQAGSLAEEGAAVGGATGMAVGATIGAIVAVGTAVAIPGVGWVAGPVLGALVGGSVGGLSGGILGGLIGLGIPESNAQAFENALREGGVVLGVQPRKDDEKEIKDYFLKHGGENVYST